LSIAHDRVNQSLDRAGCELQSIFRFPLIAGAASLRLLKLEPDAGVGSVSFGETKSGTFP
jgi:hypothetical protein